MDAGHIHTLLLRWIIEVLRVGIQDNGLETVSLFRARELPDVPTWSWFPEKSATWSR